MKGNIKWIKDIYKVGTFKAFLLMLLFKLARMFSQKTITTTFDGN